MGCRCPSQGYKVNLGLQHLYTFGVGLLRELRDSTHFSWPVFMGEIVAQFSTK